MSLELVLGSHIRQMIGILSEKLGLVLGHRKTQERRHKKR